MEVIQESISEQAQIGYRSYISVRFIGRGSWEVARGTTIGSDHCPIVTEVGLNGEEYEIGGLQKWSFSSAEWEKFNYVSDQEMRKMFINEDVDNLNISVCKAVLEAAEQTIQKKGGQHRKCCTMVDKGMW